MGVYYVASLKQHLILSQLQPYLLNLNLLMICDRVYPYTWVCTLLKILVEQFKAEEKATMPIDLSIGVTPMQ